MEAIKWRISCISRECPHFHWYDRSGRTVEVEGTRRQAAAAARKAGWIPCDEAFGRPGRVSLSSWWCPDCAHRYASAKAARAQAKASN